MAGAVDEEESKKLRLFFLPFFASGHMIPMADLAVLISRRHPDVKPTICLTPANADFLCPTLPPSVNLLIYPFPSEAVGLPPGQENLSSVPPDQELKVYRAVDLSQLAHRDLLHQHCPDAVIADIPFWWTTHIARDLGITKITWHTVGVFSQTVMNSLYKYRADVAAAAAAASDFLVRDIPGPAITMPVSELPEFVRSPDNFFVNMWKDMKKAQLDSFGVVVNTFYEIEPAYCDHYRATDCKKAWFVGPVALARGGSDGQNDNRHECLDWLDGKEEESVVFVCFGSWCQFKDEQLKEMAVGFEKSGRPFLWVVRKSEGKWVPDEGWAKRVEGRGMVVEGWVPQVAILRHQAVGAFLTHCGWNSVLESTAGGVPMLTWPLVFEQFINERLVVDVVGAGQRVSNAFRSTREEEKVVVPAETIAEAVERFMETEASEGRRRTTARKYADMGRAAVEEGGSSWNDLGSLVDDLKALREDRLKGT